MAQTILIKRSTGTATPGSLSAGELAYSDSSDKLFIGAPADSAVTVIGGKTVHGYAGSHSRYTYSKFGNYCRCKQ